jgi:hypothetical protein
MGVEEKMREILSFTILWAIIGIVILVNVRIISIDSDFDGYTDNIDLFPQDPYEWYDTDKDGYGDNSDEFPTNANLHKKCHIACLKNQKLISKQSYYPPNCDCFEVTSECKYLIVEWHLYKAENGLAKISPNEGSEIYVEINYPSLSLRKDYGFFTSSEILHSFQCPICNTYDIGEWNIYFYNGLENTDVLMDCEIYRAL